MDLPDKRMVRMLRRHHVLTLATSKNNLPWCAACFYVFDQDCLRFIFTSEENTRHISEALLQPEVSGAITLETRIIGKIRGIQFSGILTKLEEEAYSTARKLYLKRFPYTAPFLGNTPLWQIEVTCLKMTDNRMGFGKKLIWCKKS